MKLFSIFCLVAMTYLAQAQTVSIVSEVPLADGTTELTAEIAVASAATNLEITVDYDENAVKTGSVITVICNGTATDDRTNGKLTITVASATSGVVAEARIIIDNVLERGATKKPFVLSAKAVNLSAAITPNPIAANGNLRLNTAHAVLSASIYSLDGKLLTSTVFEDNSNSQNLSTQSLSAGVYFVVITTENGMFIEKIVVE